MQDAYSKIPDRHKKGFTLLEMSLVVAIIGLIVGGIIAAQSMARNAQLRGAISELQMYKQAIDDFRDKYKALPGDFSEATTLWGSAGGSCSTTVGTGTATCNGDGNGHITDTSAGTYYEEFRAWQHMANAGLITGNFTGVTGSGGSEDRVSGTNVPTSQLKGAGWGLLYIYANYQNVVNPVSHSIQLAPKHVLWLGGRTLNAGGPSNNNTNPVLYVDEAVDIDTKTDDGIAYSGNVVTSGNRSKQECFQSSNDPSYGNYKVTKHNGYTNFDRVQCSLLFLLGF